MNPLSTIRLSMTAPPSPPPWPPLIGAATVLVACQGDPPRVCGSVPEQRVFVGQTVEVQPCFEDPEGEELTLAATSSDSEVATLLVGASTISIRGVSVGSATITVTAWDPDGLTARMDIEVVVPNRGPIATDTLSAAVAMGGRVGSVG